MLVAQTVVWENIWLIRKRDFYFYCSLSAFYRLLFSLYSLLQRNNRILESFLLCDSMERSGFLCCSSVSWFYDVIFWQFHTKCLEGAWRQRRGCWTTPLHCAPSSTKGRWGKIMVSDKCIIVNFCCVLSNTLHSSLACLNWINCISRIRHGQATTT